MFRFAFITFIALRVVLCPLFCSGGAGDASAEGVQKPVHCACSGTDTEPCGDESQPTQSPSGCPDGTSCHCSCFCHDTLVLGERSEMVDASRSLDLPAVAIAGAERSANIASVERDVIPRRLDIDSGRSLRIIFASLLI